VNSCESILGIGIDIVEIERLRTLFDRHSERFLQRVFTREEQEYCLRMADPLPGLAARFAAKEAVAKAFGTGIGEVMGFTDIEVVRAASGQPGIRLHGGAAAEAKLRGDGVRVLLSCTHTKNVAAANAILLGRLRAGR